MTALERRLASELRDAADDIEAGSVPPLVLPSDPGRLRLVRVGSASWRQRAPRMLAPVAAAASVLAVVAGVAVLGSIGRSPGGSPGGLSSSVLRSVPRYYIALTTAAPVSPDRRHFAGIYATKTGALISSISVPAPHRAFVDVSAAANDRTFALAAKAYPRRGLAPMTFYLASFRPSDRSVSLRALTAATIPGDASFDGFALSPDGRDLAIAYEQSGTGGSVTEVLKVIDLASGTAWTWTSTQGTVAGAGLEPHPLSWSAGDRTLAFAWRASGQAASHGTSPASGVRLLRIASRVPGLVASSRLSVRLNTAANQPDPSGLVPSSAMLAPGARVVAVAGVSPSGTQGGFREFSVVTGRPARTLWWKPVPAGTPAEGMAVLWVSRSGRTLIVSDPPGHPGRVAVLHEHRLTLLPASVRIALPAAAW